MAMHSLFEVIANWTPHFKHYKDQSDFIKAINKSPQRDLLASTLAFVILRHLALQGNSLEFMLTTERAGGGPNVEGLLKQILAIKGISINNDILYGIAIPQDIRQQWQRVGIDPDSENEVFEYLSKMNVKCMPPVADVEDTGKKLKEYAVTHNLVPNDVAPNSSISPSTGR